MAATGFTPIYLYYTTTAAAQPVDTKLVAGELALNTTDGKLYFKNTGGIVTLLASADGSIGNVVGPASATDNALARFDLTTGKIVFAILTTESVLFNPDTYVFDVWIVIDDKKSVQISFGTLSVYSKV